MVKGVAWACTGMGMDEHALRKGMGMDGHEHPAWQGGPCVTVSPHALAVSTLRCMYMRRAGVRVYSEF